MIYSSDSAESSFIGNGAKVTVQTDSAVFYKISHSRRDRHFLYL